MRDLTPDEYRELAARLPSVDPSTGFAAGTSPTAIRAVNAQPLAATRAAHPTSPAFMPRVSEAPDVGAPTESLPVNPGIPSLVKPTTAQSHTAGRAEYAAGLPRVTAAPFTPEYFQQEQQLADFKAAHPLGSDISARPGFLGKLEHGLAKVGNIAGEAVIPNVMRNIPGTDLNLAAKNAGREQGFEAATTTEERQAQTKNLESETAQRNAPGWKPLGEPKQDANGDWFQAGQERDAQGNLAVSFKPVEGGPTARPAKPPTAEEDKQFIASAEQQLSKGAISPADRERLAGMQRTEKIGGVGPEIISQVGDPPVPADFPSGKNDPKYIAANRKWGEDVQRMKSQEGAAAGAQNATLTPLVNPTTGEMLGTFNTKTGEMNPIKKPLAGATTAAGAGIGNKQVEAFNKDYVNPAEAIERSYQMFQDAYKAIQNGDAKTGAEDMLLLSQHLGTTFGQVKGSRMNKDLIEEHKDAIGIQDRIERFGNNLASGQMLSPDQRKEFGDLISNMRNLTWRTAAKEAARNNQPINFLPADVQISMRDSKGASRPIPGDRVQEYLNKGARLAF